MIQLDDSEIDVHCPKCRQAFKKSIGWLKANDEMICTGCECKIVFDKKEFTGPMNQAQKALDDLEKRFRSLGGDITIRL
jgi:hypothetical protein